MKIGILGTGKVAFALATGLKNRGMRIYSVYGRDKEKSKKLAQIVEGVSINEMIFEREDLIIIAVSDDAISEVVKNIKVKKCAWLVHTSATKGLEVFEGRENEGVGIFYPLQSFSQGRIVAWNKVKFLIESKNFYLRLILRSLAERLGSPGCIEMDASQRKQVHIAAVFASNFTNLMLIYSQKILSDAQIEFDILKALAIETVEKAFEMGAMESQTGPAVRNDLSTIEAHLQELQGKDKELYLYLTNAIRERFNQNPQKEL